MMNKCSADRYTIARLSTGAQHRVIRRRVTRKLRSATTLVEVLVTLSVLLVMGVSAVKILGSVTEIGTQRNHNDLGRASIERLAVVFRDDVHQADTVTAAGDDLADDSSVDKGIGEGGWRLSVAQEGERVEYDYDAQANSIRRSKYLAQDRLATDVFPLPRRCDPRCQVDDALVAIQLTPEQDAPQWILEASRR